MRLEVNEVWGSFTHGISFLSGPEQLAKRDFYDGGDFEVDVPRRVSIQYCVVTTERTNKNAETPEPVRSVPRVRNFWRRPATFNTNSLYLGKSSLTRVNLKLIQCSDTGVYAARSSVQLVGRRALRVRNS